MVRKKLGLQQVIVCGVSTIVVAWGGSEPGIAGSQTDRTLIKSHLKTKFSTLQFSPSPGTDFSLHLVIRLSDRRVYLYQGQQLLTSYPIAIGREGWETPTGQYQVIQMVQDPVWQHPFTGELVLPGPENPLGTRWIAFWTDGTNYIGFHGTPHEETVGQAISHGCVRMFNQDVLALFEQVQLGTPVTVEP